jgi:hypothetical protein
VIPAELLRKLPADATAHRNRSKALAQLGRLEESESDVACALALNLRWPHLQCECECECDCLLLSDEPPRADRGARIADSCHTVDAICC